MLTLGLFKPAKVAVITESEDAVENFEEIDFIVISTPNLDLLGRNGISNLKISVDALIFPDQDILQTVNQVNCPHDSWLQQACERLCDKFPDLFKPELGSLKDFEQDIQFKNDATPIFCKPRPMPFAIQDELAQAYNKLKSNVLPGYRMGCHDDFLLLGQRLYQHSITNSAMHSSKTYRRARQRCFRLLALISLPQVRNVHLPRRMILPGPLIPSDKYFSKNLTFVVRISTRVPTSSFQSKSLRGQGEDQQLKGNVLPGLSDGMS